MSELKAIVQKHIDNFGPSEAEVARRAGISPGTLNAWFSRGLTKLPQARLLKGLARVTNTPYEDVLRAALHDIRYLPESVVADSEPIERKKEGPGNGAPPAEKSVTRRVAAAKKPGARATPARRRKSDDAPRPQGRT